jgi:cob(I)alamin adenosyltransferase
MIYVFTGDGKGKTTSALGVAWEAVGNGKRVYMVQFMKPPESSGEHFSAAALEGAMVLRPAGRKGFVRGKSDRSKDEELACSALKEAFEAMTEGSFDVVILDELNVALHLGLVPLEDAIGLMESRPSKVELVLTGRYAHPQVMALADQVLEMRKVKHHFDEGVPAKEGIEY